MGNINPLNCFFENFGKKISDLKWLKFSLNWVKFSISSRRPTFVSYSRVFFFSFLVLDVTRWKIIIFIRDVKKKLPKIFNCIMSLKIIFIHAINLKFDFFFIPGFLTFFPLCTRTRKTESSQQKFSISQFRVKNEKPTEKIFFMINFVISFLLVTLLLCREKLNFR